MSETDNKKSIIDNITLKELIEKYGLPIIECVMFVNIVEDVLRDCSLSVALLVVNEKIIKICFLFLVLLIALLLKILGAINKENKVENCSKYQFAII